MKKILIIIILSLIFNFLLSTFNFSPAYAAALTSVTDTMSRHKESTVSNHTIVFTSPTGAGDATDTITITFPAGFTIGTVDNTDIDVSATTIGELTLAAAADATHWGAVFAGQVLTLTHPTDADVEDIPAAAVVTIEIGTNATGGGGNAQITNHATHNSYTISIAGTFGDSGSLAIAVSDDDQVTSTGSVDPYLVFAVTDGTVSFGTLSISAVKTDTATMTAATNSTSGYSITVNGNTLTNGGYTIDAIGGTHAASNPGNEQYGLRISAAGGAGAAVDPYDDVAEYAFVADTADQVAASAGVSATTTYTISYLANILTTTEPGTYTATHTYICTGNY